MTTRRAAWAGLLACVAGLALAAAVQLTEPTLRPPLYDGVVTVEPYRYLEPVGTERGGAEGATVTIPVPGDASPAVALGTPEQPPQAQVIAGAGDLALPSGSTALVVTITPVAAATTPPSGAIAGNTYRVGVVNQAGVPVRPVPGSRVTLALRDPGSTDLARIELLSGGAWEPLATASAAVSGTFETSVLPSFGDFALVGAASARPSGSDLSPFAGVTAAALVLAAAVVGVMYVRGRRRISGNTRLR